VFSCMENNFLDLHGLKLSNDEFTECIHVFDTTFKRKFIKYIDITCNNIDMIGIDDVKQVFPNIIHIYVDNIPYQNGGNTDLFIIKSVYKKMIFKH
jgi:hypothetical protein